MEPFAATAPPRDDLGARAGGTAPRNPSSAAPLHECARVRSPPIAILLLELPAPRSGSFHREVCLERGPSLESRHSRHFARSPASLRADCWPSSDISPPGPPDTLRSPGPPPTPQIPPGLSCNSPK